MTTKTETMTVLYYKLLDGKPFEDVVYKAARTKMNRIKAGIISNLTAKVIESEGLKTVPDGVYTIKYHVPKNPFKIATVVINSGI